MALHERFNQLLKSRISRNRSSHADATPWYTIRRENVSRDPGYKI